MPSHEGRDGRGRKAKEKTIRVLTEGELMRATRTELSALLRRIAGEPPNLPEGSRELRAAHANLQNIRRALARPRLRSGADPSAFREECLYICGRGSIRRDRTEPRPAAGAQYR
jgi:hypothetical protein